MELATDIIFLSLLLVNNDLFFYAFATSVGCDIRHVGTAELKNTPCISARVTCTINFSVKDAQIKDLDTQIRGGKQISKLK